MDKYADNCNFTLSKPLTLTNIDLLNF